MEGSEGYDMSCHFLCPGVKEEDDSNEEADYLDDDCSVEETDHLKIDLDMLDDGDDDGEYISDSEEPELTLSDGKYSILGRDKKTIWSSTPLEKDVKIKLFEESPGCAGDAKHCKSHVEAWSLFFTDDMLQMIVESTNKVINITRPNYSQEKSANPTNVAEIKAVIGLTYIIGALRGAHLNTSWIWSTDGTGIEIFSCLMSQRRYIFLLRSIRFTDDAPSQDPLSSFRWIFQKFVANCQRSFILAEKCVLDAALVPFRGECPFLRYMPGETAKYGIKVYCLVDSETHYISNLDVCVEKQTRSENPSMVGKNMCRSIMGSGRILTCSHRFSSVALAEYLLDNHIRSVCALKRTSSEIPSSRVSKTRSIPRFYRKGVLLPSPDGKSVLYSTFGGNDFERRDLEEEIFGVYNDSKAGFETAMKTCNEFSLSRKSSRWSLAMFYFLLNVAGSNSQIIVERNNGKSEAAMEFLKNLGRSLAHDHLQVRANTLTLPKHLLGKARQFAGLQDNVPAGEENCMEPPFKKFKRCEMCPRSADRKTKEWCIKCRIAICREHGCRICVKCKMNL